MPAISPGVRPPTVVHEPSGSRYVSQNHHRCLYGACAYCEASMREELVRLTDAIDDGRYQATPGDWCHHCDFLRFCEPGKQEVGGH